MHDSRVARKLGAGLLLSVLFVGLLKGTGLAGDWPRFRGPNGSGVSPDSAAPPVEWSETKNLKWKAPLPGPGLSSPILVGDKIFLTCWTGYGVDRANIGDQQDLKRRLVCLNRETGATLWYKSIDPVLPEDAFRGMFAENGYATHTPASDGERVYVFFGKTGVFAFDLEGKELWHKSVGTDSDPRRWGSSSSPVLYKNLVIIPATVESHALIAFDKVTGEQVWRQEADGFGSTWGTPVLVDRPDGEQDLVIAVPQEIWAFNPDTGKLRWYCESVDSDSMCSSVVAHDGIVYAVEGRNGGSVAVRAGGEGDVTKTHVLWSGRDRGRIGTPIYFEDRLYWISGGIANCIDAKTGKPIFKNRLGSATAVVDEPESERPARGGGGRGGRGGGGGRGGQDYSSPVVADGKLYYVNRSGQTTVIKLGTEYEQLASNRFESDTSDYNATPAIVDGELFIRSNAFLYCVGAKP